MSRTKALRASLRGYRIAMFLTQWRYPTVQQAQVGIGHNKAFFWTGAAAPMSDVSVARR